MKEVDVLVVGGGPAGLATAERIARGGSVLVVHRDREIGRPVRSSGGTWLRHVRELGIPARFYHPITKLVFAGPSTTATFPFAADQLGVLDITGTYQHLANLAMQAGAAIWCGTRFARIEAAGPHQFKIDLVGPQGQSGVRARYVIDASGHARAVIAQVSNEHRFSRYGLGVECEFENLTPNDQRAVLFVGNTYSPAGYGWVFPTNIGTVRVGIGVQRPDVDANPQKLMETFLECNTPLRQSLKLGKLLESHTGIIPAAGPARRFQFGRVIAVGDSVGQALPLVGEGIRYCIEAGRKLGDEMAAALLAGVEFDGRGYQRWWDQRYRARFELAQVINERISGYDDARWDSKVRMLSLLSPEDVGAALRMDYSAQSLVRFVGRHPQECLRFGWERLKSRLGA